MTPVILYSGRRPLAWAQVLGVWALIGFGAYTPILPRAWWPGLVAVGLSATAVCLRWASMRAVLHLDHLEVRNFWRTLRVPWPRVHGVRQVGGNLDDPDRSPPPSGRWADVPPADFIVASPLDLRTSFRQPPRRVEVLVAGRWQRVQALSASDQRQGLLALIAPADPAPQWLVDGFETLREHWQRFGGQPQSVGRHP